jgi:hypothetical protein
MRFDGGSSARILPLESRHMTYIIVVINERGVKKSRGPKEETMGSQGECGFAWQMHRGRRASPISIILSCCFFCLPPLLVELAPTFFLLTSQGQSCVQV